MKRVIHWIVRRLVRTYQICISPLIGPRCRYLPTCSEYFLEALESHGLLTGTAMGIKRIARCHPWGAHGYDPVPGSRDSGENNLEKKLGNKVSTGNP